jgi:phenylacetate-CoA ligase
MHLFEDRAVHQYWDPDSDEVRLVEPGELGEYTFTNLDQRILATWFNFRTRDSATYTDEPCVCGRPGRRMWIHDRLDDMRKIRGINVFASGVEALVREIPRLGEEFQLVVTEDQFKRVILTVRAEALGGNDPADLQAEARALQEKLRTAFGMRMEVELTRAGELPRWELKARRWVDLRDGG